MKKILTLALTAVLLLAALAGCTGGKDTAKQLTPEERTTLYKTAIESARDAETNEFMPIITSADDESAALLFDLMGVSADDMSAFAISASAVNIRAYGVAAIYPAADKADTVKKALEGFVDLQKQNFQQYLVDQYEVASNAKLETLEDGTLLLVMSEGQDAIFDAIKTAVEAGPSGK